MVNRASVGCQHVLKAGSEGGAFGIGGQDLDLIRGGGAQPQLGRAGKLLLAKDRPPRDFGRGAVQTQDRHAHRVDGNPVGAGKHHTWTHKFAFVGAAAHKGFHAVQHDQGRLVSQVDLGDHEALIGGVVQLSHIVVVLPWDALGNQADRVLEREGEVSAVTVGLQTASLDDRAALQTGTGKGEAESPVTPGQVEERPAFGGEFIQHQGFDAEPAGTDPPSLSARCITDTLWHPDGLFSRPHVRPISTQDP